MCKPLFFPDAARLAPCAHRYSEKKLRLMRLATLFLHQETLHILTLLFFARIRDLSTRKFLGSRVFHEPIETRTACSKRREGMLPKRRSATGPRSQRHESGLTYSILAQFPGSNALRTGTVRAPFEIQSFGQHAREEVLTSLW